MPNLNPQNKFQKGDKRAGRKPGQPNLMTRDIKTLLREAAANTGFMEKVPVLDPSGKPTVLVWCVAKGLLWRRPGNSQPLRS
jgi:hypothetical protein